MRRTQAQRRADTRASLLEAAAAVIVERGYQGASVEQISARAGCTKGALYDHFGSKEGLMRALLEHQYAARIAQFQNSPSLPPSQVFPFDRDAALLFLEFVCAAARDDQLRAQLAGQLRELRTLWVDALGDPDTVAAAAAGANGASIEGLIFSEAEGGATFDRLLSALQASNP
ncbi:MAG: TetR/AcrR family transcriptional regulator [Solirubrobacterales bacterium]|nr:TetR/AcrR family transcriptional regulator [Solirubrobacterales bacterium]